MARRWEWGLVAATAAMLAAGPAIAGQGPVQEGDVLSAFNGMRADPLAYAAGLRTYRGYFHESVVVAPGITPMQTEEGVAPVDELITQLGAAGQMPSLAPSTLLAAAAADHVAEQGASGKTGHYSADGATPGERVVRHGGGKGVTEVIAYGAADATDVIRQLMIDDGVRDRGHRIAMLAPRFHYAGVACGPHKEFGSMCVIDMSETVDGRAGSGAGAATVVAAASYRRK